MKKIASIMLIVAILLSFTFISSSAKEPTTKQLLIVFDGSVIEGCKEDSSLFDTYLKEIKTEYGYDPIIMISADQVNYTPDLVYFLLKLEIKGYDICIYSNDSARAIGLINLAKNLLKNGIDLVATSDKDLKIKGVKTIYVDEYVSQTLDYRKTGDNKIVAFEINKYNFASLKELFTYFDEENIRVAKRIELIK